jgi:hypothetical protein
MACRLFSSFLLELKQALSKYRVKNKLVFYAKLIPLNGSLKKHLNAFPKTFR